MCFLGGGSLLLSMIERLTKDFEDVVVIDKGTPAQLASAGATDG